MADIDKIYRIALENAARIRDLKRRFLFGQLKENLSSGREKQPVILLSGLRGVGKTTIMLQLFSELKDCFYLSADSMLVRESSLYNMAEEVFRNGSRFLFIDEIHKYPRWIEEIKSIYDDFDLRVVASGSSTAALKKGGISLGRRAENVSLAPLSFGEFYYLREGQALTASIDEAVDKRLAIGWLAEHRSVERYYREYMASGGFPGEHNDHIFRTVRKMIYEDALAEFSLTENKVDVCERLLGFLSLSKPGEFSYTSFSSMSGYSKSTVFEGVILLTELDILRTVEEQSPKSKAKRSIKLLFSHPNLRSAFAAQLMKEAEVGAMREEYFVFHMSELGFPLFLPPKGRKTPDYCATMNGKNIIFEISGPSKGAGQLRGVDGKVIDDINLMVLGFVQKIDRK